MVIKDLYRYFWKLNAGFIILAILLSSYSSFGQRPRRILEGAKERITNITSSQQGGTQTDTTIGFKRRNDLADSITISYRFLDSLRIFRLDSSLNDFNRYYSVPPYYVTLGNNGGAAYPCTVYTYIKTRMGCWFPRI
jgi:hypothetical protein